MKTTTKDETLVVKKDPRKDKWYIRIMPIETARFPHGVGFAFESEDKEKVEKFKDDIWDYLSEAFGLKNEIIDDGEDEVVAEKAPAEQAPIAPVANSVEDRISESDRAKRQQFLDLMNTPEDAVISLYLSSGWKDNPAFIQDIKSTTPEEFAESLNGDIGDNIEESAGEQLRVNYDLYNQDSKLVKSYNDLGVVAPAEMSRLMLVDLHKYVSAKLVK